MTAIERVHEHISGSGALENPYDLSEFPHEWFSPNEPIRILAETETVYNTLQAGSEIFLKYFDSIFIVSLIDREEENIPSYINVDALLLVNTDEASSGAIRLDLDKITLLQSQASRITHKFEEAFGLRPR